MKNSIRIKGIKTTEKGEKLIVFCRVFNDRFFNQPYEGEAFFASSVANRFRCHEKAERAAVRFKMQNSFQPVAGSRFLFCIAARVD